MTHSHKNKQFQRFALSALESIDLSGDKGAPGAVIYEAIHSYGASMSQYQPVVRGLLNKGKLIIKNGNYHITKDGQNFMSDLKKSFEMSS